MEPTTELELKKQNCLKELAASLAATNLKEVKHSRKKKLPQPVPYLPKVKHDNLTKEGWLKEFEFIQADYHKQLVEHRTDTEGFEPAVEAKASIHKLKNAAKELLNAMEDLGKGATEALIIGPLESIIDNPYMQEFWRLQELQEGTPDSGKVKFDKLKEQLLKAEVAHLPIKNEECPWTERLQALVDHASDRFDYIDSVSSTTGSIPYYMRMNNRQRDLPLKTLVYDCLNSLNLRGVATEALGVKLVAAILRAEAPTLRAFKEIEDEGSRPIVRWFMKDNPDLEMKSWIGLD